jgi:predicted molibdopterin-dependent oxidoreductase YjgC
VTPHEESRPAWHALSAINEALGGGRASGSARESFEGLAAAVASFAPLTYETIGDQGAWLAGWGRQTPPVGVDPKPGVRAPVIV